MKKVFILKENGNTKNVFTTKKALKFFVRENNINAQQLNNLVNGGVENNMTMEIAVPFEPPKVDKEPKPTMKQFIEYKGLEAEFKAFKEGR